MRSRATKRITRPFAGRRLAPANLADHLKNLSAQLDDFIRSQPRETSKH
ncbi:MAG: hypothetical protein HZA50_17495 [Planctomycetes bacterium]|nr:hypothetical protein [Planctomycetota bacterium]